mmetsp:Transcript_26490/g.52027  ORF Transcript_26490/g.52027 Transcript_26490/m.52027 type:complete len:91 (-) Transcript_26490:394-666(-)
MHEERQTCVFKERKEGGKAGRKREKERKGGRKEGRKERKKERKEGRGNKERKTKRECSFLDFKKTKEGRGAIWVGGILSGRSHSLHAVRM